MQRSQRSRASKLISTSSVAAIAAALSCVGTAQAQLYWDSGGGANTAWSNAANWDSFGSDAVPTFVDNAFLNNGGTITISDTGNQTASLLIGAAADTGLSAFNLGLGGTVNFNDGGQLTTASSIPTIDIGVAPGSTNVWNHNGGTVTTGELFRVGVQTGSTGTLNMHAGTIDVSTGDTAGLDFFLIGDNGNGTCVMDGGTIKSRGLFGIALQASSTSTMTMSAGTIQGNAGFDIGGNSDIPNGVGAKGTFTMTGGTATFGGGMRLGTSAFSNGTVVQSGGSLTARDLLVGLFSSSTYTISGNATLDLNGQLNIATFTPIERPDGAANQPASVVTQSGTSAVTTGGMVVGEFGDGTYNMNGGTLTVLGAPRNGATLPNDTFANLLIGRDGGGAVNQGRGTFNHTAGVVTVNTNIVLGDFDDSNGVYTISGGTLTVGGDLRIGAALATNAPPDATRLEPSVANGAQGQALRTNGTFTVRGGAATINVAGKLIANPADKGAFRAGPGNDNHATLGFQVGNTGTLSSIMVAQQADLDGAVIDMGFLSTSTFLPTYLQQYVLVNAASFGATGTGTTQNVGTGSNVTLAVGDALDWAVSVIAASGGRQSLIATNLVVPGDANNDKRVNFQDLVILAQNYNMLTGKTRATGDFNRSAGVDFADLVILAQNYNFGTLTESQLAALGNSEVASDWALAQTLVPEPATVSTIAGVGLLLGRRQRAKTCG